MKEWTDAARQALEAYLEKTRYALRAAGGESEEVVEDVRRHVDEELRVLNSDVVTEEAVSGILRRMGPAVHPKDVLPAPPARPVHWMAWSFHLLFGVILPAVALGIELATAICADGFFNPIPSVGHILLVAFVPLANLLVLVGLNRFPDSWRWPFWLNAAAMGIAAYYTLVFAPLAPLAVLAIVFMGMGLLPLAPFFSLLTAILLRVRHRYRFGIASIAAAFVGLIAVPVVQVRSTLTSYGLSRAGSSDSIERAEGIRFLRRWGDREEMLRACYARRSIGPDILGYLAGWTESSRRPESREIYYRVTGELYDSVPPPRGSGKRREDFWERRERDEGLSLSDSRIDGVVDPDAATAYLEWTFVFDNSSPNPGEARAEVALPPGGVVSRVTLWVNGEPREAAYGSRSQTRQAYERVVNRRQDPLLVTTRGTDRVLVQCFPVPSRGTMKIRIGITCPLELSSKDRGILRLPYLHEMNFEGMARHEVWIDSTRPLASGALTVDRSRANVHAVRGSLESLFDVSVVATRDPAAASAWSDGVRQVLVEEKAARPPRVVFVIDGSKSLALFLPSIAEAVGRMPGGVQVTVLIAGDDVVEVTPGGIASYAAVGGCDNLPALEKAWDLCSEHRDGAIVWIHGPHPILFGKAEALRQRSERRPGGPHVLDVQLVPGPNRIAEELDGLPLLRPGPRDLGRLVSAWRGDVLDLRWNRTRQKEADPADAKASAHVARLWAHEEIALAIRANRAKDAQEMAVKYQLVTPVSGAAVLETNAQYEEAGLRPVAPDTVPTIPEPEEWLLFLIAIGVFGWAMRRRRLRAA